MENGNRPPLRAGAHVRFVDERGRGRPALVTAVWREPGREDDQFAAVNLVIVSPDERRIDPYGRAIERRTCVVHHSRAAVPTGFWSYEEEAVREIFATPLTH